MLAQLVNGKMKVLLGKIDFEIEAEICVGRVTENLSRKTALCAARAWVGILSKVYLSYQMSRCSWLWRAVEE